MRTRLLSLLLSVPPALLCAQSSPFVDGPTEQLLANELSGDLAFETLRLTTQWHKPSGSEGFFAVARYVEEKAKSVGLRDVRWIDQVAESAGWTCRRGEAWLIEGEGQDAKRTKLGSFAEVPMSIADNSRSADVTAEIVDVQGGTRAADYEGKKVRGKIVLAYGSPTDVMEQAVWRRGAAGILSWASTRLDPLADSADQVAWLSVPETDGPKGEKTTFAFILSPRQGKALSDGLRGNNGSRIFSARQETGRSLRAHIRIESVFQSEKKTAMVEARILGTDPSLPEVVLTSHLQENISANDNQSGVANMLEIGRALTQLIADGDLPRPRRSIRFWWCDEIYSEYRYFADHPGEEKRFLANLNQDMVGARQSVGSRVQHMARTPWSRPSYLSDVQESVLDAVVAGNNAYLPAWQADSIAPGTAFSHPIFSRRGTREPFHARALPYFDSTDHMVFDDSWVGVPGTTLTNWPDEYIHSSDDDLWQIDPTQLKRNAFIVASTALWLANANAESVRPLAGFVAARAAGRLSADLATALQWIRAGEGSPAKRYRAAADLLAVSLEKEIAAVDSSRQLGPVGSGEAPSASIPELTASLRTVAADLRAQLDREYASENAGARPPDDADPVLLRLSARVPRLAASTLHDWLALERRVSEKRREDHRNRRDAKERAEAARKAGKRTAGNHPAPPDDYEEKLSPLMQSEAMNWIDGKATAADVARRTCAEALSAGWWYYGETTPTRVEKFLERQARDGLITWAK
jgi:hypothetical protein